MARVIGLTGGIASGKSHVAEVFFRKKIPVISADALAREAVSPGSPGLLAVSRAFPGEISPDGAINRQALGRKIFADSEARRELESILHPLIRNLFLERRRLLSPEHPVVVYEVPLLLESGAYKEVDLVVVVDVPEDLQRVRLMHRDGLSEEEARARIRSQMPRDRRIAKADRVIDGRLSPEDLDRAVDDLLSEVRNKSPDPRRSS